MTAATRVPSRPAPSRNPKRSSAADRWRAIAPAPSPSTCLLSSPDGGSLHGGEPARCGLGVRTVD